jgi:hypothetical protein
MKDKYIVGIDPGTSYSYGSVCICDTKAPHGYFKSFILSNRREKFKYRLEICKLYILSFGRIKFVKEVY